MNHLFPRTSVYFAQQLKLIRNHLELSYAEFGGKVELSPSTISRIEARSDKGIPSKRTWNKINLALLRMKYFARDDLPEMEIPNHIVYAIDDMKKEQDQPKKDTVSPRSMIIPITHPCVRTFWQPSRKPHHQNHSTT